MDSKNVWAWETVLFPCHRASVYLQSSHWLGLLMSIMLTDTSVRKAKSYYLWQRETKWEIKSSHCQDQVLIKGLRRIKNGSNSSSPASVYRSVSRQLYIYALYAWCTCLTHPIIIHAYYPSINKRYLRSLTNYTRACSLPALLWPLDCKETGTVLGT